MRKWVRRMLWVVAIALCVAIGAALVGLALLRGTPGWYQPVTASAAERAAAAERAERKLIETQNWAAETRAIERRAASTTQPAPTQGSLTVSFTESELNAFFDKWSHAYGWAERYGRFVSDPLIMLDGGRIVLAGRMKELDAIVSFHFAPRIDPSNGRLHLSLERVQGGHLPLPEAVWDSHRERILTTLRQRLPAWQAASRIDDGGDANQPAINAAMARLVLEVFGNRPAEPVLFLPLLEGRSLPVHLSRVEVGDDQLTFVVQPMTADERAAFLEHIRMPYERAATALSN